MNSLKAKTLIVAVTSLTVEPASSLIRYFKGKDLIIINNDKTPYDYLATLVIHDKFGNMIKELTKQLIIKLNSNLLTNYLKLYGELKIQRKEKARFFFKCLVI